jgi:hypothetical protein
MYFLGANRTCRDDRNDVDVNGPDLGLPSGGAGCVLPAVMLVCAAPTAVRDCAPAQRTCLAALPAYLDQAVALR